MGNLPSRYTAGCMKHPKKQNVKKIINVIIKK